MSHRHLFFFNDTATTEIYTLSLPDALPISVTNAPMPAISPSPSRTGYQLSPQYRSTPGAAAVSSDTGVRAGIPSAMRSEEHTSELQSQSNLVCRLLLEKKKTTSAYVADTAP